MKNKNAIIITTNVNLLNSINFVLKDFMDILVFSVVDNMEDMLYLEKKKHIDILFWDADLEKSFVDEQLKKISKTIKDMKVIYISSNPENVLKSFKFGAIDFIQKPVSQDHLVKAVKKIKYLMNQSLETRNREIRQEKPIKFIAVSSLKNVIIIPVESILYMQSEGRYTLIYKTDGQIVVSSKNLGLYEKLLNKNNFFRIHHSFLVNIDLSVKIEKEDGIYLQIINKKCLPISKRKVEKFYRFLKIIA